MLMHLARFLHREDGATAIEYGLIAALVSVAAIGALTAMGNSLATMFNTVSSALSGATAGCDRPSAELGVAGHRRGPGPSSRRGAGPVPGPRDRRSADRVTPRGAGPKHDDQRRHPPVPGTGPGRRLGFAQATGAGFAGGRPTAPAVVGLANQRCGQPCGRGRLGRTRRSLIRRSPRDRWQGPGTNSGDESRLRCRCRWRWRWR